MPSNNDFWSQAIASLIGALGAFILSILLFLITQSTRNKQKESAVSANAASELEVHTGILEEIRAQIDDLCSEIEIETNKAKLYVPMKYSDILSYFTSQAYGEGLLREILTSNEITELNRLIGRDTKQTDDLNIFALNQYKGGNSDIAEVLRFFRGQKKQIEKDVKFLREIKNRLEKLSVNRRPKIRIFSRGSLKS